MKKNIIIFLLLFISCNSFSKYFKDNERIVFIGNSITHAGYYHFFFDVFLSTKYHNNINIMNKGISGDSTTQIIDRLNEDILIEKPTTAFIMAGMNDINYTLYSKKPTIKEEQDQEFAIESYKKNIESLIIKLISKKINVILFTPTIYDESNYITTENHIGANKALSLCSEYIKYLSKKYNLRYVDFYTLLNDINKREQSKDSTFTIIGNDRIHPGLQGHYAMNYQIIKTICPKDSIISDVCIDYKKKKIIKKENSFIKNIKYEREELIFDIKNKSLPIPLTQLDKRIRDIVPFEKDFNIERLCIKNLPYKEYNLIIDNNIIGKYSNEQLSNGIRIDSLTLTPQYKQAVEVWGLCKECNLLNTKIRNMQYVERKLIKTGYKGKNIDSLLEICKKELKKISDHKSKKSYTDYHISLLKEYIENIKLKDDIYNRITYLRKSINEISQPLLHNYILIPQK